MPLQELYFAGDVITYQCFSGFVLDGEELNTCLMTGAWSQTTAPTCSNTGKLHCALRNNKFAYFGIQ